MEKFIQLLKNDEILVIPTETVFGIAVDAKSDVAIKKLYSIKKRSENKPLQIMICDSKMAQKYCIFNDNAHRLAKKYWPGSLSIVLNKKENTELSQLINNQDNTIALRVPNDENVLNLIISLGSPLAVTSANISGKEPILNVKSIRKAFGNEVTIFGEENINFSGRPSTIIDLSGNKSKILREGAISL